MATDAGPPEDLLAARRALSGVEGFVLLEDWEWYEHAAGPADGRWVLRCRLSPPVDPAGPIPASTDWYVLVDPAYPWGYIEFYPAKDGGLSLTFPHQNFNGPGDVEFPWRELHWRRGNPCLETQVRILGRHAYDQEPYGVHERLKWRSVRALMWLEAASRDELLLPGEPFELPQVLPVGGLGFTFAFQEGSETLGAWEGEADRAGIVELFGLDPDKSVFLVDRFLSASGESVLAPVWGKSVADSAKERLRGLWLRLDGVPVLYPWQNPFTWGELREACQTQGQNFDVLLRDVAVTIRDGRSHPLLIGFSIPERVGGPPHRMHWYAAWLPTLSHGLARYPGFRPGTEGAHRRIDRSQILVDSHRIGWQLSENWHPDDISSRGKLQEELRSKEVLLLGAGALGSAVAELLVRGGVKKLLIVDGERLEVGNLVRHNLGLDDLHENKASALARRLNFASPHAEVEAINEAFPPNGEEEHRTVSRCDVILDCTGEDSVLRYIELFPWEGDRFFASFSLGFGARRLFCCVHRGEGFPLDAYRNAVDPHLQREIELYPQAELPREGAGCWHPLFPARIDDLWPMASAAVKCLESVVATPPVGPRLDIFERFEEGGVFASVRRVDASTA